MEPINLVPKLTGPTGPGVKVVSFSGENGWRAFDRLLVSNSETYAWYVGGNGWRSLTLEFDSTVTVTEFIVQVGYAGLTNISKESITVDGVTENFSTSISYTTNIVNYRFTLTKPLRGKRVVLQFYTNNSSTYIQEILLMGYPSTGVIGIEGKLFSIINGKLTLISETDDYTLDLEKSSASLYDIATNMSSIQSVTDRFSLQTIIKE